MSDNKTNIQNEELDDNKGIHDQSEDLELNNSAISGNVMPKKSVKRKSKEIKIDLNTNQSNGDESQLADLSQRQDIKNVIVDNSANLQINEKSQLINKNEENKENKSEKENIDLKISEVVPTSKDMSQVGTLLHDNTINYIQTATKGIASIVKKRFNFLQYWDPYTTPPDLEKAIQHGKANRVGKLRSDKTNKLTHLSKEASICPCCGLTDDIDPLHLCTDVINFSFMGSTVVLYFVFIKVIAFFMLVATGFGIAASAINYYGGKCGTSDTFSLNCSQSDIIDRQSPANYGKDWHENERILRLVMAIVLIIVYLILNVIYILNADKVDIHDDNPRDFTLKVKGQPKQENEENIKSFFNDLVSKVTNEPEKDNVVKISLSYYLNDYVRELQTVKTKFKIFNKTLHNLKELENNRTKLDPKENQKIDNLDEKIKKMQQSLHEIQHKYLEHHGRLDNCKREIIQNEHDKKFTGQAFITFQKQSHRLSILKQYKVHWYNRCCTKNCFTRRISCEYKPDVKLCLKKAMSPSDILWENAGVDPKRKRIRKWISTLIAYLCLVASFAAIYGLKTIQTIVYNDETKDDYEATTNLMRTISFLVSCCVSIINIAINTLSKFQVSKELKQSKTELNRSMMLKIIRFQFINNAVVITIVHFINNREKNIGKKNGLLYDAHSIMLTSNLVFPLINHLFNPFYFLKLYKRYMLKKNLANSKLTQQEANDLFEGTLFSLPFQFAAIHKGIFTAFWFYPVLPISPLYVVLGLILRYGVQKYLILRRYSRPVTYSFKIAESAFIWIKPSILILGVSSIIFDEVLYDKIHWSSWAIFAIGMVFNYIPFSTFIKAFIDTDYKESILKKDVRYDDIKMKFFKEYDRTNPITAKKAQKTWYKNIQKQQKLGNKMVDAFHQIAIGDYNVLSGDNSSMSLSDTNDGDFDYIDTLFENVKLYDFIEIQRNQAWVYRLCEGFGKNFNYNNNEAEKDKVILGNTNNKVMPIIK